jgi:putative SOS response-associated peptidase YedK
MWAPCLWDEWVSKDGSLSFKSFAIITDDPPPEIEIMGHDRCPIFLKEELIDSWLNPQKESMKEVLEMLQHKESVEFKYSWVD